MQEKKPSIDETKLAQTQVPLHPLLAERWSPRAFDPARPVEREKILAFLEAARWSASCFNEQPWHIIVGEKGAAAWQKIYDALVPANQAWCITSPLLLLFVAKQNFTYNDSPNKHGVYDTGQSAAYLTVQATADGLYVHQMAGFSPEKARELFAIPEGYLPITVAAVGYMGELSALPEKYQESEIAPRTRKPLAEIAFSNGWGEIWK